MKFRNSKHSTFPDALDLLNAANKEFKRITPYSSIGLEEKIRQYVNMLGKMKPTIRSNHVGFIPEHAYRQVASSPGVSFAEVSLSEILSTADNLVFGRNEFYSVYDVSKNEHVIVDERIREILGLEPSDLNINALAGLDPNNPLYHPSDVNHAVRCAILCYLIIGMPGFEWPEHSDFYRARFRVGTAKSNIKSIRDLEYVILEKRGYLSNVSVNGGISIPLRHFDRWTVFWESEYNGVEPYFSSDPFQTKWRNLYFYLFHIYLIGIHPKYLLMLDERRKHDRNKSICESINKNILKQTGVDGNLSEQSVADAFSKTIRRQVAEAVTYWDRRGKLITIESDSEAIRLLTEMCLLPMPESIRDLICANVNISTAK